MRRKRLLINANKKDKNEEMEQLDPDALSSVFKSLCMSRIWEFRVGKVCLENVSR